MGPFRSGHTWAIAGALTAGLDVPPIFVPEVSGQTATIVAVRAMLESGQIEVQLQRNGVNVDSAVVVTTSATTTAYNEDINDMDELGIVLGNPVSSPSNLSYTLVLEHSA